jgi:hypothetical protein
MGLDHDGHVRELPRRTIIVRRGASVPVSAVTRSRRQPPSGSCPFTFPVPIVQLTLRRPTISHFHALGQNLQFSELAGNDRLRLGVDRRY